VDEGEQGSASADVGMTPMEVRQQGYAAVASCRPCQRSRTLRLALLPARFQRRPFSEIPLRCMECGERVEEIHVQVFRGGRFVEIWRWIRPLDADGL
jgi:hypothetical protein